MKTVSVIMPFYKKKEYVESAIKSVLGQTFKDLELIIIYDDKSKDDFNIIQEIIKDRDNIKIIDNKKSLGAGLSRNIGINNSVGNYIAFLDSDDIWHENKIEKQLNFMKKNEYLITHTSYNIIDETGNKTEVRHARDFLKTSDLLKSCDIGLSTVMIKKTVFDNECMFPELKTKEDFVLWLKILEKNISIFSINELLVSWRKTTNSLSSSTIQKIIDGYKVYNKYMKYNPIKSIYYLVCLSINYLKKRC